MKIFLSAFFLVKLISSLLCVCCNNLLFFWGLLELNFFSSLPLLVAYNKSMSSKLFFFLMNTMSSVCLVYGFIGGLSKTWLGIFVLLKLGILFPFFWYPIVLTLSDWRVFFVLLMSKKIPPFALVFSLNLNTCFFLFSLVFFGFFCASMMLLNTSFDLKLFLSVSSISQTCLLFLLCTKLSIFVIYFLFYSFSLFLLLLTQLHQYFYFFPLFTSALFFFQSGFPPTVIFFMKLVLLGSVGGKPVFLVLLAMSLYMNLLGYVNLFFFLISSNNYTGGSGSSLLFLLIVFSLFPMLFFVV